MPASAEVADSCCASEDGWSALLPGCCSHASEAVTAAGVLAPSAFEGFTAEWDTAPALTVVNPGSQPAPKAGTTTHTILRS